MNKIVQEVKKMMDNGWCFDCSAHLQTCIQLGMCQGHGKEVDKDAKEPV